MECEKFREGLLDAVYEEGEAGTGQAEFSLHRAQCAACREEFASLMQTRRMLSRWTLKPQIVARRRSRRAGVQPLAAAAMVALIFGAGVGLGTIVPAGTLHSFGPRAAANETRALIAQAEQRQQERFEALRAQLLGDADTPEAEALARRVASILEGRGAQPAGVAVAQPLSLQSDWIAQVDARIQSSERRQTERWLTSLAELDERAEARRRLDMARISAGLSYLDGKSGQQVARTAEIMGYMLASQRK